MQEEMLLATLITNMQLLAHGLLTERQACSNRARIGGGVRWNYKPGYQRCAMSTIPDAYQG